MLMRTPEYWEGKRINRNTFENMDEFGNICEITGRFVQYQNMATFRHFLFEQEWLLANRIYVESAASLSEDGYEYIMDVLDKNGKYDYYCNNLTI